VDSGTSLSAGASPSATEALLGQVAAHVPEVAAGLTPRGRDKLVAQARLGLSGQNTLVPVFHLARMAALQRSRGFAVAFPGLEGDAPHDLLIARDGAEAEVACDVFTAGEGRDVHQGAWLRPADRVDPALRAWLSAHPGRHLLKITLPLGLRGGLHEPERESETFNALHQRILAMLGTRSRHHHDEAVVLRLDPLLLAGAQDGDGRLRHQIDRLSVRAQHRDQLIVHDLDHHLAWRHRLDDIGSNGLAAHLVGERTHDVEHHIRLEQRTTHFAHGGADIGFGQGAATGQLIENAGELVCQALEHEDVLIIRDTWPGGATRPIATSTSSKKPGSGI